MRNQVLLLLLTIFFTGVVRAQSGGYLYIESEPSRPFYIRTHDSLYSSSPGNYIILAPLRKMTGEIIVGFPGAAAAFSFTLKDTTTEQGLILRDLREEGWRLYDFRKNELINVRRLGRQANELNGLVRRNDAFALRLSQVVNDSIILYYKPAGQVVTKAENTIKPGLERPKEPVQPAPDKPLPRVRRLSKLDLGSRWLMQYESREGQQVDTIQVEIDKPVKAKKLPKTTASHISASHSRDLFSQYEQVFHRGRLPRNQLRWFPEAAECAYCAG
jgi:hypothetical protein